MGGIKFKKCNELVIEIWEWCSDRNIWLNCCYIFGKVNIEVDRLLREFND